MPEHQSDARKCARDVDLLQLQCTKLVFIITTFMCFGKL